MFGDFAAPPQFEKRVHAPVSLAAAGAEGAAAQHGHGEVHDDEPDYEAMLNRIFAEMHRLKPELMLRTRKKLKPPEVERAGSKRTAWANIVEVCGMLNRDMSHVQTFFLAELGTTGVMDGQDRFLIKGRYMPRYIETLLRKYIAEYVTCQMCKSLETELERDPITRLYFMTCKSCGSKRSVLPIKSGYHAVGRGERRRARARAN